MAHGHTPTDFKLRNGNAVLCSGCEHIIVLTKAGTMRKHGQCGPSASPLKSSGSLGPPHSQEATWSRGGKGRQQRGLEAGKADNSQTQQQAGDANEDEEEVDRENEAGEKAAALKEETENDENQNEPQDKAGKSDAEA